MENQGESWKKECYLTCNAPNTEAVALIVVILRVDASGIVVQVVRISLSGRRTRPEVAVATLIVLGRVVPIPVAVVLSKA